MSKNGWVTISAIASRPGEIRVTIDSKNPKLEKNEFSDQVPYHYRMYYEASLRDMGTLKADFTNRMQAAGKYLGADRFSCTVAEAAQTIRHLAGANILAEYGGTDSYEKELTQQQELTKQRIQAVNLPGHAGGEIIGTFYKYEETVLNDFAGCKSVIIFKSLILEYIKTTVISTIIVYLLKNNTEYLDTQLKSNELFEIFVFSFNIALFWIGIKSLFTNKWKLHELICHIKRVIKISVWVVIIICLIGLGWYMFTVKDFSISKNLHLQIITKIIYFIICFPLDFFLLSFPFITAWSAIESEKYNIEPGKKDCDFCQESLLPSQMLADNYDAKKLWQCRKCGQRVIADSYRIIATSGVSLNKP